MSLYSREIPERSRVMLAGERSYAVMRKPASALGLSLSVLCTVASGCAWEGQGSQPIPLRKAVHNFEKNVGDLHIVVLADAYGATKGCPAKDASEPACWSDGGRAILDSIKFAQCLDLDDTDKDKQNPNGKKNPKLRTRNPLIPVATGPLQLTVQGQFTEGGTFTIAAAPSAAASISRQTAQQVMLPLTLVSLVGLPGFYMGQQLTNLQYTTLVGLYPNKDLPGADPEKAKQQEEFKQTAHMVSFVMDTTDELAKISKFAEDNFNKLPATEDAQDPAHYCYGFEEGKDVTVSPTLKGAKQ